MPNSYNSTRWTGPQLDSIYPIGSIYMSVNSTDPGTLFGGTWEQIQDTFLLCAGSTYAAGSTGGSASTTSDGPSNNTSGSTTLTTSQIPAHTHGSKTLTGQARFRDINNTDHNLILDASGVLSVTRTDWSGTHDAAGKASWGTSYKYNVLNVTATHEHTSVGGGSGHTHTLSSHTHTTTTMPPYLAVYVFKRIA